MHFLQYVQTVASRRRSLCTDEDQVGGSGKRREHYLGGHDGVSHVQRRAPMRLVVVYAVHKDATVGSGSQAAERGDATEKEMATAPHTTGPFRARSYETLVRQMFSEAATPIVRRWPSSCLGGVDMSTVGSEARALRS